jgi:hypothetical protein
MHWRTLRKILAHSQPPGYRMARARPQPKPIFYSDWPFAGEKPSKMGCFCMFGKSEFKM